MSYFAAALVRGESGWTSAEMDLDGAQDVEAVADALREVDPEAALSLLFVESDDEFLVMLRLDEGDDLRVFGSDVAFADVSKVGDVLLAELEDTEMPAGLAPDEEEPDTEGTAQPVGDADLLADLGISAHDLLALCAHEGLLPGDVMLQVSRKIGCADALIDLRGE